MANLDQISPEIISKIAGVIGQKLKALGELSRESYGGVHAVAEMFNRLDSSTSKEILEDIEQNESQSGGNHPPSDVRLRRPAAAGRQSPSRKCWRKVDRKILTVALKGTSEQMKNSLSAGA